MLKVFSLSFLFFFLFFLFIFSFFYYYFSLSFFHFFLLISTSLTLKRKINMNLPSYKVCIFKGTPASFRLHHIVWDIGLTVTIILMRLMNADTFKLTRPPVLSALLLILSASNSSYQTFHRWFCLVRLRPLYME